MNNLPDPIIEDLIELTLRDRQICYLQLDQKQTLLSQGGELSIFGLNNLQIGRCIEQQVDLFTGLLDLHNLPVYLPFMQTPSGVTADIHLFIKDQSVWVLLMHTEEKKKHHQAIQQKVYDLRLNQHRQNQILNQYLGKEVAERLDEGMEQINRSGERRNLTVMFADLRGFTRFSENIDPEKVFEVLNVYLARMIPVVLNEKGVLDKIIGDEVMAIFGMLSNEQDAPGEALQAAIHMLTAIESLNRTRLHNGEPILQIGIGLATGPVSLGILGSRHRKSLTVIGNHVNLAARLQGQASAKQLIIDDATYQKTSAYNNCFSDRLVTLKGYSSALNVHQFELDQLVNLEQRLTLYQDDPTLY